MKKILSYLCIGLFALLPFAVDAQSTGTLCTGDIRVDLASAQDCAAKATAQGQALGYTMSCKVEQLGLGGFTDPTSGKDYILNTVCSVNGSEGHGAQLLVGWVASPDSNAIVRSINPGWDILKTELGYESAFNQCGGKAPYASVVNGVNVYSCTAPVAGAVPVSPSSIESTKATGTVSGTAIANQTQQAIFASITKMVQNILRGYDDYTKGVLGFTVTGAAGSSSSPTASSQCYMFTRTLQNNDSGKDVFALTYALKQAGLLSQTSSTFDTTVMTAVKRFQELHSTEILSMLGLTQGTGVVADKTRAYLNSNCLVPSYIVENTTNVPVTPTTPSSCTAVRTGIKNGKYQYTFSKNTTGTWTVTLNNPAYKTSADPYYVPANYSFTATDALDLNRQNQGKFNYLQTLPGTAEGNTEYANLFGSFNNAYYDWDAMTKDAVCTTATTPTPVTPIPVVTQTSSNQARYVRVSVNDWDTLPLALREIVVQGQNNTIIKPVSVSATDFDVLGYQPASNVIDGNENTIWRATKTSGNDLQVITLNLGSLVAVDRIKVVNYGFTDTRVFTIEISTDGNTYRSIAEVRARENAPIADKGVVWGVVTAPGSMGPIQY